MDRRALVAVSVLAALPLAACGGSSGSPTDPEPVPTSLAGRWQGELSGDLDGASFTCTLRVTLSDGGGGVFLGSWRAGCPGAEPGGIALGNEFAGIRILTGFSGAEPAGGAHPLEICGWLAPVDLQGSDLTGTWEAPDDCTEPGLSGGPLQLRFEGP